jgi:hypothetical protein
MSSATSASLPNRDSSTIFCNEIVAMPRLGDRRIEQVCSLKKGLQGLKFYEKSYYDKGLWV